MKQPQTDKYNFNSVIQQTLVELIEVSYCRPVNNSKKICSKYESKVCIRLDAAVHQLWMISYLFSIHRFYAVLISFSSSYSLHFFSYYFPFQWWGVVCLTLQCTKSPFHPSPCLSQTPNTNSGHIILVPFSAAPRWSLYYANASNFIKSSLRWDLTDLHCLSACPLMHFNRSLCPG